MVELQFITLDVFTTTRFKGNPLAIVYLPPGTQLTQEQKQTVTREFNLSETVFLHRSSAEVTSQSGDTLGDAPIDIFTIAQELPFAGHPTVGTSYHLLSQLAEAKAGEAEKTTTCALITKAGRIPASFDPLTNRARLEVPHAITIHSNVPVPREKVAAALGISSLSSESIIPNDVHDTGVALVSVVKGLAFLLVRVSSLEVLGAMRNTGVKFTAETVGLEEQPDTFIATYAYYVQDETPSHAKLRTRMFEGLFEDSATGSAASCLSGYLSIRAASSNIAEGVKGTDTFRAYEITQGVEMGRQSDIAVDVQTTKGTPDSKEQHRVEKMWLSGAAVTVMKGIISV